MKNKRFKLHYRRVFLFLFVASIASHSFASNPVKVATIGGRPSFSFDPAKGKQASVIQLIEFWKREINQVLPDKPDLILLPELCDVPFGLPATEWKDYLRVRQNQISDFFARLAKANRCYVAYGTLRIDEKGFLRNSAVLLNRNGEVAGIYNKNFPTIGEIEDGIYPGDDVPVFQCDFGKVAFAICFDLNFEELLKELADKKPNLILFPSNYHGAIMQNLWAYRCQSFFVGSINGLNTRSEIRNPLGEVIASSTNYFDYAVTTINLNSRVVHLGYNFGKLAELKKKYGTLVSIYDPGRLGPVLVSSESKELQIEDMLNTLDIEPMDSYFDRSRAKRREALKSSN